MRAKNVAGAAIGSASMRGRTSTRPVASNAWHVLRVEFKGTATRVMLDGKAVIAFEDGGDGPGVEDRALPKGLKPKARVVLQSGAARKTLPKTDRHLRALMVGHLRAEKSPQTYFDAARLLIGRFDILLDHVGAALDPTLGVQATSLTAENPSYRWLGGLPHAATRRRIQAAHVLVHPSQMEGGAHVVIEAVRSGTPVLASRIDGNVGLLGESYDGYFAVGVAPALATLLQRLRDEPAMLFHLQRRCEERAPLFDPAGESATLHALIGEVLDATAPTPTPLTTRDPP